MFSLYEKLLEKIDSRLPELDGCACPPDCHQCCRISFTVFPVEAYYLRTALSNLTGSRKKRVEAMHGTGETCPFLVDRGCLVYPHRPVLCRTHGYPFVRREEGQPGEVRLHAGCEYLAEESTGGQQKETRKLSVLDLDPVNEMLIVVNGQFMKEAGVDHLEVPLRIPMSDVPTLRLEGGVFNADV